MRACSAKEQRVSRFGRISQVDVTGSTNEDAAKVLGEEHARGLTIVADYQQRGSGRKGRSWIAAPGTALLCTIVLPDALRACDVWAVPFWTALVVGGALSEHGVASELQWPNDLLLNGRKIAGILCISRIVGEFAWVGCGIGVNVSRPKRDRDANAVTASAAFVSDVTPLSRQALLHGVLQAADAQYELLAHPQNVSREWEKLACIPGARYRLLVDGTADPFEAKALRLLPGGALLVESEGERREIALADARVLR